MLPLLSRAFSVSASELGVPPSRASLENARSNDSSSSRSLQRVLSHRQQWHEYFALVAIALTLTACSKPAVPDFEKVLDGFGAARPVDKAQPVAMEANIYVNYSQSMKGFAIVSGSN